MVTAAVAGRMVVRRTMVGASEERADGRAANGVAKEVLPMAGLAAARDTDGANANMVR